MEDQRREAAIDVDQDDELDLSLGLRPALSRRILYLPNPAPVIRDGSSDLSLTMSIWGKRVTRLEQEPDGLGFLELRAKRQAQALGRKEARRKRVEKRKLNVDSTNLMASERLLWFENSGRRLKVRNCNGNGVDATTIEFDSNQLKAVPYLMVPGLAVSDGNGAQSVVGAGGVDHVGGGVCDQLKRSISSSSRGSSSVGSDYQSTSGQGGSSSDDGSNSSHSHPLELTIKSCTTTSNSSNGKANCNSSSHQTEPTQTSQSACLDQNSKVQTRRLQSPCPITRKPPKPNAHQMPRVTTTGNGPDGKRITGLLYKYSKLQVSIMCICHGTSFSPAGFVEHAGGIGIDNPLRHITISPPSAFS